MKNSVQEILIHYFVSLYTRDNDHKVLYLWAESKAEVKNEIKDRYPHYQRGTLVIDEVERRAY